MFELPEDEVPPENLWHSETRLKDWFDSIKQRREDRMKGVEEIPEADGETMVSNQLVDEYK